MLMFGVWLLVVQDFVVFFSPLDEFDAPKEKKNPKGIHEALNLWKNVRQTSPEPAQQHVLTPPSVFEQTVTGDLIPSNIPIVLLLNKVDLLKAKLGRVQFSDHFSKYKGKNDVDSVIEFVKNLFLGLVENEQRKKSIFVFSASAVDAESVRSAWAAARQQTVSNAMADTGL